MSWASKPKTHLQLTFEMRPCQLLMRRADRPQELPVSFLQVLLTCWWFKCVGETGWTPPPNFYQILQRSLWNFSTSFGSLLSAAGVRNTWKVYSYKYQNYALLVSIHYGNSREYSEIRSLYPLITCGPSQKELLCFENLLGLWDSIVSPKKLISRNCAPVSETTGNLGPMAMRSIRNLRKGGK